MGDGLGSGGGDGLQGIFLPFSAFLFSFVRSLLRPFSSIIHFFLDGDFPPRFLRDANVTP